MVSWSVPTSASGSAAAERSIGASGVVVNGCLARFTEIIGKSSLSSDSESVPGPFPFLFRNSLC